MTQRLYKIVRENYTDCYSGTLRFDVGATVMAPKCDPATPDVCGRGIHACFRPMDTLQYANHNTTQINGHLLIVEPVEPICDNGEKMRSKGVAVLEEVSLSLAYGPCGEDVVGFLRSLKDVLWFKPVAPISISVLQEHINCHTERLRPYGYTKSPTLRIERNFDAAWVAARDAAWDAARDAAYRVVADKMPTPNPFSPLMQIWKLGCWPICVNKGQFIVYVPENAEMRP